MNDNFGKWYVNSGKYAEVPFSFHQEQDPSKSSVLDALGMSDNELAEFGWIYDADYHPPAPTPDGRLTRLEFLCRFTDAELCGIYTAAKTVVQVEVWLAKFNAVTPDADGKSVNLYDERTITGVQGLEAGGLLAAGRVAEILAP